MAIREHLNRCMPFLIHLHQSSNSENGWFGREEGAPGCRREDPPLCDLPCFVCGNVELRHRSRVDELIKSRIKTGIGKEEVLVAFYLFESHMTHSCGDNQAAVSFDHIADGQDISDPRY